PVRQGRYESGGAQPDALLRGRELRPVHALPGGNREGRQADGNRPLGSGVVDRALGRHARRLDLRPRPGGAQPVAERVEILSRGPEQAARELVTGNLVMRMRPHIQMRMLPHAQMSSPRKRGPIFQWPAYGARWVPAYAGTTIESVQR